MLHKIHQVRKMTTLVVIQEGSYHYSAYIIGFGRVSQNKIFVDDVSFVLVTTHFCQPR